MTTLLLSDDLMLGSQVSAAAQQSNQTVRTAPSLESLLALCADEAVCRVIVDLNVNSIQADTALQSLQQACPPDTRFLAIAPHVHTAKINAAKDAGFDRVLTRGQFHRSMRELLAE